ncbi:hypothetical protein CQA38_08775, partial [Campylobacter sp. MIT 12-5580]|uniref:hypothetical protein n=1 Tax=Campylobacter sp. MIT 12-5580 TaxID=2040651 RepID=UPI0010FA2CD8
MKLKKVQSKKLCLSIATLAVLGISNLGAVDISLDYAGQDKTNIDTYFDIDSNTQISTLKDAYKNDDLTINSNISDMSDILGGVRMDLGEHALIINNNTASSGSGEPAYISSPTITAKNTTFKNMILQAFYGTSTFNGNLTLQGDRGAFDTFGGGTLHTYGSRVIVATDQRLPDGSITSGAVRVNGNLVANETAFQFVGNSKADQFVVTGTANITNTGFVFARENLGNLSFTNEFLIRANGGFNADVTTSNGGGTSLQLVQSYRDILTNDYSSFEEQFGEQLNSEVAADVFIDDAGTSNSLDLFEYSLSLSEDKKSLLMTSKVTDEVKKLSKQLLLKKEQLEIIKTEVQSSGSGIDTTLQNAIVADLDAQINSLTTLIAEAQNVENQAGSSYNFNYSDDLRKQIADILNPNASEAEKELSTQITQKLDSLAAGAGVSNDRRAIFLDSANLQGVASALNLASDKTTANQIFDSILTSSASLNEAVSIALSKDNFAKTLDDINSNATSQANANSASSSVSSTMNLSNDMAIGSRLASLNNPFANLAYAKKLSKA